MDIDRTGFTSIASTGTLDGGLVTPFVTPATTGGGANAIDSYRSKFIGSGTSCRLKITNSTYDKRPTFVEYELFAQPRKGRIS